MKLFSLITGLIVIILFAGCSGPKITTSPLISNKTIAEKEMAAGNYAQAVNSWKLYFSQTPIEQTTGDEFAQAAQSAFKSGDQTQSVNWFDQARYKNFSNAEMYLTLAKIYNSQQNISKELSALEYYKSNFNENLSEVNERLYQINFEIKMFDKALLSWAEMDENSKNEISNLKTYFKINKAMENTAVCDSLSLAILDKETANVDALEWNGNKYYWLGENRYQLEIEKYNKNKTNKQYKILLTELDLATADFKKALPFFEKLWKIEPGEKYASYMANIYARFGDESKVDYYRKFMK